MKELHLYECEYQSPGSMEIKKAYLRPYRGFWLYVNYASDICIFFAGKVTPKNLHSKGNTPVEISALKECLEFACGGGH